MKVRALRAHPYAGRNYKRGQEYEILRLKDAKILVAVKAVEAIGEVVLPVAHVDERKAESAGVDKVQNKKPYSRRDMSAEVVTGHKPKTKRNYSRRDLQAKTDEDSESSVGEE